MDSGVTIPAAGVVGSVAVEDGVRVPGVPLGVMPKVAKASDPIDWAAETGQS